MADGEERAAAAGLAWPEGDPDGLRRRARSLAGAARSVGAVAVRVGRERADRAGWEGAAAARYDASVAAESAALRRTADGLGDAARALESLAAVVDTAQEDVARWAARVLEMQDRVDTARAAVPTLVSTVEGWGRRELLPELEAGQRAARMAARLDGELAVLRARALAAAGRACERVDDADRRCASGIASLAAAAPLPGRVPASPPATPLGMAVARAFAPVYHFDGGEDHYPMDVRDWVANADRKERDGERYWDPRGEDVRHGDLDGATLPVAYHVTADGQLQLEYGTFYAFNDFPRTPSVRILEHVPDLPLIGGARDLSRIDHEGDFEPVTVQFRGGRPDLVDYESHGHAGTVPWVVAAGGGRRGRPQVYPARGGHGNHPSPDRYDNDFTGRPVLRPLRPVHGWRDDSGTGGGTWDPADDVIDARSVPALRDPTRFGEDTGANPRSFLVQGRPPDLDGELRHPQPR